VPNLIEVTNPTSLRPNTNAQAPKCGQRADRRPVRPSLRAGAAPKDLVKRLSHLGAAVDRPLPERLDIVGVEVQDRGGAADAERREDAQLGKLVGQHDGRVAEPQLDLHQLAAGHYAVIVEPQQLNHVADVGLVLDRRVAGPCESGKTGWGTTDPASLGRPRGVSGSRK